MILKKKYTALILYLLAYSAPSWGMDELIPPSSFSRTNLRENTYVLQHVETSKIYCPSHNKKEIEKNQVNSSFKFIAPEDSIEGFYIQNIVDQECIGDKKGALLFHVLSVQDKYNNMDNPPYLIKLKNSVSNQYLGFNARDEHTTLIEGEPKNSSHLWLLHPLYPTAGYSDFFSIVYDFGQLLASKYSTKLKKVKTLSSAPHDRGCLSISSIEKIQYLTLGADAPGYKSSMRKIFGTEDHYYTHSKRESSENETKFKITRVLETEKTFQFTIENSISTVNRAKDSQETMTSQKDDQMKNSMNEVMDQVSFDKKLNTQINFSLSKSNEQGSEKSTTKSKGREDGSAGALHVGAQASISSQAKAGVSVPGVKAGVGVTSSVGVNIAADKTDHKTKTSGKQENTSANKTSGSIFQDGRSLEEESNQQNLNNKKNTSVSQSSREVGRESKSIHSVELEHTVGLTQVTTTTNKQKEQWVIEREFYHKSGTLLRVDFYEESLEFIDVPFCSRVNVSGYVGFTFEPPIPHIDISFRSFKDHLAYNTPSLWCITPATLIRHLPAPGYEANEDGSINYSINGKLSLKQPLQIQTIITEVDHDMLNTLSKEEDK